MGDRARDARHAVRGEVYRQAEAKDLDALLALNCETFGERLDNSEWLSRGRVLVADGDLQGALLLLDIGQFYGGCPVPVAAITGVMVPGHLRGLGRGSTLMREALRELRDEGVPLAVLHPSTVDFYHPIGFSVAGLRAQYSCAVDALHQAAARAGKPHRTVVEPWGDDGRNDIAGCYRAFAQTQHGLIARDDRWWRDRILASDRPLYRYVARTSGEVSGYVVFDQSELRGPLACCDIDCREFVWRSGEGLSALLAMFADRAAVSHRLFWWGPGDDPILWHFDQHDVRREHTIYSMTCVLLAERALEARGYPDVLDATLQLEICDAGQPTRGAILGLEIHDGHCVVHSQQRRRRDRVRAAAVAFAPLFTGHLTVTDARRLGLVSGEPRPLRLLERAFAGPRPWVLEHF